MNRRIALPQESEPSGVHDAKNQLDFSTLYDRYAPALLGFILRNVFDKAEATTLLEMTFMTIHSQMDQFQPKQQPLFAWLLVITRHTVLEALKERSPLPTPVFQLTTSGKLVALPTSDVVSPTHFSPGTTDPQLKALLDAVLFKNCTPEEAADSIGLPAESARQQLRLAMQQLRVVPLD